MIDLKHLDLGFLPFLKRQPGSSVLGLAFDAGHLDIALLTRTNGAVKPGSSLTVPLSLDPLTDETELVGREIRKHLDAAGVRERWCAVCLPLAWALTHTVKLPELSEPDLAEFLALEAERGFPYGPDALMTVHSPFTTPDGERHVTMVAIPRDHVLRLEAALRAAQLRPVTFSLGIVALPCPDTDPGVIALVPGHHHIDLQVSCQGGVAALRTVEGAFELEGGEKQIQADHVAREIRITLGQLPDAIRDRLRCVRVFGRGDVAEELAEQLQSRLRPVGITVESVPDCAPEESGLRVPAGTPASAARCLALRYLATRAVHFEFLPPKVSAWKRFSGRYSSRKLAASGLAAAALALVIALAWIWQQWQLARWQARWTAIQPRVTELETMQRQIKTFRPWFSDACRSLTILRQLTDAFPEDGALAAKTFEIRPPATVTCTGTARDNQALLRTLDKLRAAPGVSDVKVEQMRGKSPIQFSFVFQANEPSGP
ncbi:MAG: hypothetical protein JXQ71_14155 [Verrucomicrobia bacterium]|nr:hypothetical protein [Verrucomicrobiota bacterium]